MRKRGGKDFFRDRKQLSFFLVFLLVLFLAVFFSVWDVLNKEFGSGEISLGPISADLEVGGVTTEHFDLAVDKSNSNIYLVYQENTTKVYNKKIFNGNSWSAPEPITGINSRDKNPKIAVDTLGNIHLVFQREGNTKIAYMRYTPNGWTTPVDISQSDTNIDGVNDGSITVPQIAVDSRNNVHIASFLIPPDPAYPGSSTPFYYISKARYMFSKYNGAGWDSFITEDKEYKGSSSTRSNGAHPAITVDKNDNLHMVYMGSPWAILVHQVRSLSGTWSSPQIIQCTSKECPVASTSALYQGDGVGDFMDIEVDNNGVIYVSGQWTRGYDSSSGYAENYVSIWSTNGQGSSSSGQGNWKRWRSYRYYWDPMSDIEVDSAGNVYMVWSVWTLGDPALGDPWKTWTSTIADPSPLCTSGENLVDRKAHYMIYDSSKSQWLIPSNDPCPPTTSDVLPNLGSRHRTANYRSYPRLAVTSSGVYAFWIDRDNRLQLYMTPLSRSQATISPTCSDVDGDGYGQGCLSGSDCNDNDPTINPGRTEVCGDGKDNDCSSGDLTCSGQQAWRSSMFGENWQAIDKIGPVEGVNIFSDSEGTKDPKGSTVSSGPNYHPKRFLHDFSYAGYHAGEKPVPPEDPNSWTKSAKIYDVTKVPYNCVADGKMDCRSLIQAAINDAAKVGGGIIYLPSGEYRITARNEYYFIKIINSNIVIRGDGPDKTKIKIDPYFGGVYNIYNKRVFDVIATDLWTGNLLSPTAISKDLPYPTKVIPVADVDDFKVGDPVTIYGTFNDASLREHDMLNIWPLGRQIYVWRRDIVAIDGAKKEITIDVPTRYRVNVANDNPRIAIAKKGLSEIGFEHLSFGMIRHEDEWGNDPNAPIIDAIGSNNIIYLTNVENGWLYNLKSYRPVENANRPTDNVQYGEYDVEILNNVFYLKDSRFITVKNFHFKNMQVDDNPSGGYGYASQLFRTNDILVENGTFQKVKKGMAFNQEGSSGNVIKDVVFKEIFTTQNDFHSYLSASNLLDNNNLQGTYWEAAIRPIDLLSESGGTNHGHGTTQSVFWNTRGEHLTISILDWWDRDNNNDGIVDNPAIKDEGIIVSNQYGWGYIIGTYGPFSDVITARMSDRMADLNANGKGDDDPYRPYNLPRDYKEGIGYDKSSDAKYSGKTLCPRSLYEAQLAIRLGKSYNCVQATLPPTCSDVDGDGYGQGCLSGSDCNDNDPTINPGRTEVCGDGKDNDCSSGDLTCSADNRITIDNIDSGFSESGDWQESRAANAYGTNSVYSAITGDLASWSTTVNAGVYQVYAWWTYLPSRSESAPYSIYNGNTLLGTVRVNQNLSNLGGKWNLLGEYTFNGIPRVSIKVEGGASYSADAVSFIKIREITNACTPVLEICNNLDDDCDGTIDEGVKSSLYRDLDGDTYGAGSALQICAGSIPEGYVMNNIDCDDNNNALNVLKECSFNGNSCGTYSLCLIECPFRAEDCGNNIDENCDGTNDVCSNILPNLEVNDPNETVYKNSLVPISYTSLDALNCGYTLNGIKTKTSCSLTSKLSLADGNYELNVYANNSAGEVNKLKSFRVIINRKYKISNAYEERGSLGLIGDYTDEELERVSNFEIYNPGKGKIEFLDSVNLTKDANTITGVIKIDGSVNITESEMLIDGNSLSSLAGKRVRISFEDISVIDPLILRNDAPCSTCFIEGYDDGELAFSTVISGMDVYSLRELASSGGNNEGNGGGGGGSIFDDYREYNENPDSEEISENEDLQRVEVDREVKYFAAKNNERVVFSVNGKEYSGVFSLNGINAVLDIEEFRYYLDLSKSTVIPLDTIDLYSEEEPNMYLGIKESYPGRAIIAIGLVEQNVKDGLEKEVNIPSDKKGGKFILISGLIIMTFIIGIVIVYLTKINKSKSSFEPMTKFEKKENIKEDNWTKEKRFEIRGGSKDGVFKG